MPGSIRMSRGRYEERFRFFLLKKFLILVKKKHLIPKYEIKKRNYVEIIDIKWYNITQCVNGLLWKGFLWLTERRKKLEDSYD